MPRSDYKNTQGTGHHGKIQPSGGVNSVAVKNSQVQEEHAPHIPGRTITNFHTPPLRRSINLGCTSWFYVMANSASLLVGQRYFPHHIHKKTLDNIKQHNRATSLTPPLLVMLDLNLVVSYH